MHQLLKLYFNDKAVVVSHRNSGLGDNLLQAAVAWLHAKKTGKALFVNWSQSRYLDDKRKNAFPFFFDVPSRIDGVPIIAPAQVDLPLRVLSMYPPWVALKAVEKVVDKSGFGKPLKSAFGDVEGFLLKRKMKTETRFLDGESRGLSKVAWLRCCFSNLTAEVKPFFDALKLNVSLQAEVDQFCAKNFGDKKPIGVHVRFYHKQMVESAHTKFWIDPDQSLAKVEALIREAQRADGNADTPIFLSTDSAIPASYIREKFSNVVSYEKQFSTDSTVELHDALPLETASASLVEMFLLAKCPTLVRYPPDSWFSHYASLYANKIIS